MAARIRPTYAASCSTSEQTIRAVNHPQFVLYISCVWYIVFASVPLKAMFVPYDLPVSKPVCVRFAGRLPPKARVP